MEWTLTKIKAKVRDLTGRPSTFQLSEADLLDYINAFYQYVLPNEIGLIDLETWFELETSGTDSGAYALDPQMQYITTPITIDGVPISFSQNPTLFFELFPRDAEDTALRQQPSHCLLYDRIIYLRPLADKTYTLKAAVGKRPDPFGEESGTPEDNAWGPFIAYGVAIDILSDNGEDDEVQAKSVGYEYHKENITRKQIFPLVGQRSIPRY